MARARRAAPRLSTSHGKSQPVAGILSLEYARIQSLTALVDRPIPPALKAPLDFFTYRVIALDPDTLLMLVATDGLGGDLATTAYTRTLGGNGRRHVHEVDFTVISHHPEPAVAPDGATTALPAEFHWTIRESGRVRTEIRGTTTTRHIYGLGRGWIGGYGYHGAHEGRPVSGTGYLEYASTTTRAPRTRPVERILRTRCRGPSHRALDSSGARHGGSPRQRMWRTTVLS